MEHPKLIVSAVGLTEGGPLSILLDLAAHLHPVFDPADVVYLIHGSIAPQFEGKQFETYSWPKASWAKRLYFEKMYVKRIERRLEPKLWISLHDITASLDRTPQLVYCHNPSPFYDRRIALPVFDLKFQLFTAFYEQLYSWGIHANQYVIVQQNWMRDEFVKRFGLSKDRVTVAHPVPPEHLKTANRSDQPHVLRIPSAERPLRLIYPAFPRVLKNIEFIGELARALVGEPVQFEITIDGNENEYARFLREKYGNVSTLCFIGRQPRVKLLELYRSVDALIFPSRQETWGLPLSEFMETGRPILAADMPYAHEVLSGYAMADLFALSNIRPATQKIRALLRGEFTPRPISVDIPEPLCADWSSMVHWLTRLTHQHST